MIRYNTIYELYEPVSPAIHSNHQYERDSWTFLNAIMLIVTVITVIDCDLAVIMQMAETSLIFTAVSLVK